MSNGSSKRSRPARAAALKLPPGKLARALAGLRRADVLLRLGMCLATALLLWVICAPWVEPFAFRTGKAPSRDVGARLKFDVPDLLKTQQAENRASQEAHVVYRQDSTPLIQLRSLLVNRVLEITAAATLEDLDMVVWREFRPATPEAAMPPTREEEEEQFEQFRAAFVGEGKQAEFEAALTDIFARLEQTGLLEKLEHSVGNQLEIIVYDYQHPKQEEVVQVADVLISVQSGDESPLMQQLLSHPETKPIAGQLFQWLRHRLARTLSLDQNRTDASKERAAKAVVEVATPYQRGQRLAAAGSPLGPEEIGLLKAEHAAAMAALSASDRIVRSTAMFLLILGLCVLCGGYILTREPQLATDLRRLAIVMVMAVLAVGFARWLSSDAWRAEIIPLLLFAIIIAIAYGRPLSLLLSLVVVCIAVLATGQGLGGLLILGGTVVAVICQLTVIRSRLKLINVSVIAAAVAIFLSLGLGVLNGQTLAWPLLVDALQMAGWTIAGGFLITGLLPFVEGLFGVFTDLSLLELSDVSHPLLQELVRRAPGTYNHSMNVGSLAESAAEAIGARGLLVRVGAYFHDIGKMLKPGYFAENQGEENRHEDLVPAMSTLIIVAHVKDGVDLARSHHLPRPIIDFIEQHHGTTLVEFFYQRASEQRRSDPDSSEVVESAFRYPGPKPRTKEAAVLMLADAVESASRTLVEPAPARLESLVEEITMQRLMDGQFDECGIDLTELRTARDTLAKSLIAVYHGRVKYPDQQRTA